MFGQQTLDLLIAKCKLFILLVEAFYMKTNKANYNI